MKIVDWRKKRKFKVKDFDELDEFDIIVVSPKFLQEELWSAKDLAKNDSAVFAAFNDELLSDVFYKWYQYVLRNLEERENDQEKLEFFLRNEFPFKGSDLKKYDKACNYLNCFIEEVLICLPN